MVLGGCRSFLLLVTASDLRFHAAEFLLRTYKGTCENNADNMVKDSTKALLGEYLMW